MLCLFHSQVYNFGGTAWGHCVPSTSRRQWMLAGTTLGPLQVAAFVPKEPGSSSISLYVLTLEVTAHNIFSPHSLRVLTRHHPGPRRGKLDSTSLAGQVLQECMRLEY